MGDFVNAIGQGVSGLVGGSLHALSIAFDSVVAALSQVLPGFWLPLAAGVVLLAVFWWLFKK